MSELEKTLRKEFLDDKEYAHAYMEQFVNAAIATQIKVLREDAEFHTQQALADDCGMKQERISALENVNYDAWSIKTLRRLARSFDVVLKVSFEQFSDCIRDVSGFGKEALERKGRVDDLTSINFSAQTFLGTECVISRSTILDRANSAMSDAFGNVSVHSIGGGSIAITPEFPRVAKVEATVLKSTPNTVLGMVYP